MKVLLVRPPSNAHLVIPPLGLAYLAAYCGDHEVKILDCMKEKYDHKMFEDFLKKENPDLVGITAFSMDIKSAVKCLEIVKKNNKNIITIFGGAHTSNKPVEVLKIKSVDYILVGEAEESFPLFLKMLEGRYDTKDVPGLGFKTKDNKIIINSPKIIEDLDKLKFPRWDLLRLDKYPHTYQSKRFPSAPIMTSRGCPFRCTYCTGHTISGRRWRFRSPENVMAEIKILYNKYHIRELSIWDDNFTLDRARAEKICRLLIKENMDIIWNFPNGVRIGSLDEDLLKLMKRAGCYEMGLGIESCSDRILEDMKKSLTVKVIKEKVPLVSKAGIKSTGFFILGYPTETIEDIKKTIKISKKIKLDRARYFLFQALPGSEIYRELVNNKRIPADLNWEDTYYSRTQVLPYSIKDKKILERLQRNAILSFYLRPHIFIKYILENSSLDQIKELMHMIKLYIFHKYEN